MDNKELIKAVFDRAVDAHQPTHIEGLLQLAFPDAPELSCRIRVSRDALVMIPSNSEAPDATITIRLSQLRKLYDNPCVMDTRLPEWEADIQITGRMDLIHYMEQLLKRPTPESEECLKQIDNSISYGRSNEVATAYRPNQETIAEALRIGQPMIAKGLLDEWDALTWDIGKMRSLFGALPLRRNPKTDELETLGQFIDEITHSRTDRAYTNGCLLPEVMSAYFQLPSLPAFEFSKGQIWFGRKREGKPVTLLHRDLCHNTLAHIWGRKKFVIYPPSQHRCLYPYKSYNFYQPCLAQPHQQNDDVYPSFKHAVPIEFVLEAGDFLILPAGWFHCVWALDDVFSVSKGIVRIL